ncbi:MAG: hypothetical protein MZW92_52025 [Comamonadaceae bacterium]|nr:hypothetical protein [Comamonadaceae bacterium]
MAPEFEAELERVAGGGRQRRRAAGRFLECRRAGRVRVAARRMMGGELERQADAIVDAYREASRRFGDRRASCASVVEHSAPAGRGFSAVKSAGGGTETHRHRTGEEDCGRVSWLEKAVQNR